MHACCAEGGCAPELTKPSTSCSESRVAQYMITCAAGNRNSHSLIDSAATAPKSPPRPAVPRTSYCCTKGAFLWLVHVAPGGRTWNVVRAIFQSFPSLSDTTDAALGWS